MEGEHLPEGVVADDVAAHTVAMCLAGAVLAVISGHVCVAVSMHFLACKALHVTQWICLVWRATLAMLFMASTVRLRASQLRGSCSSRGASP